MAFAPVRGRGWGMHGICSMRWTALVFNLQKSNKNSGKSGSAATTGDRRGAVLLVVHDALVAAAEGLFLSVVVVDV